MKNYKRKRDQRTVESDTGSSSDVKLKSPVRFSDIWINKVPYFVCGLVLFVHLLLHNDEKYK